MHTGLPPNFGTHAKGRPLITDQKKDTHGSDRIEYRRVIVPGVERAARIERTLKTATLTRIRTDDLLLAMSR